MNFIKNLFTFNLFKQKIEEYEKQGSDDAVGFFKVLRAIISSVFYSFLFLFVLGSYGTIDEGERGVKITLGKMHEEIVQPGIYTKWPIITKVKVYETRTIREERKMDAVSKDIQKVFTQVSASYNIKQEDVKKIYSQIGTDWQDKLVWNNLIQSSKDVIGKYQAANITGERDEITSKILEDVNTKLANYPVEFTQLQLINVRFTDEFENAVENKVVATQKAEEAKNKTKEIEEQAKQKVIAAEAEAKSMRIRSQALASNPKLTDYEAVQKWNGELPQIVGGSVMPFINMDISKK